MAEGYFPAASEIATGQRRRMGQTDFYSQTSIIQFHIRDMPTDHIVVFFVVVKGFIKAPLIKQTSRNACALNVMPVCIAVDFNFFR